MKVNDVLRKDEVVLRVLVIKAESCLCIDCNAVSMPTWVPARELEAFTPSTPPVISASMSAKQKQKAHSRYTLIAPVLTFLTDDTERNRMINRISEERGVSKQTLRRYVCRYLVYQDVAALAPVVRKQDHKLTQDQKNMRWALNKYYYTTKKSKLTDVYVLLLKEKYCDAEGNCLMSILPCDSFVTLSRNIESRRII